MVSAANVSSHLSLLVQAFPSDQSSRRSSLHQALLANLIDVSTWGAALECEVRSAPLMLPVCSSDCLRNIDLLPDDCVEALFK